MAQTDMKSEVSWSASLESDQLLAGVWNRRIMALARITVGVLWLSNLGWKTPTNFGVLHNYARDAVVHPVVAPFSWAVKHVVLPHFTLFAWTTLFVETLLAACLLTGLLTRLFGVVSAAQSAAIGMSVARTPGEWPWSYYLMILASLVLVATAAGRTWGLDELIRPVLRTRHSRFAGWLMRCS